jgi:hypothetical protein
MKVSPSLRSTLGRTPSEDVLRQADELKSLIQHPGWEILVEWVGVQAEHVTSKVEALGPLRTAALIAENPANAARMLASAGGEAHGLRQFEALVLGALALAERVRSGLEIDDEEEGTP